ncbi:hypothetical protein A3Q37_03686 [Streptomyces sp. PTY087I2]|nr:hypothetical protein A3Q37_03686 [Streptomyces sp. PTY087I2]
MNVPVTVVGLILAVRAVRAVPETRSPVDVQVPCSWLPEFTNRLGAVAYLRERLRSPSPSGPARDAPVEREAEQLGHPTNR